MSPSYIATVACPLIHPHKNRIPDITGTNHGSVQRWRCECEIMKLTRVCTPTLPNNASQTSPIVPLHCRISTSRSPRRQREQVTIRNSAPDAPFETKFVGTRPCKRQQDSPAPDLHQMEASASILTHQTMRKDSKERHFRADPARVFVALFKFWIGPLMY